MNPTDFLAKFSGIENPIKGVRLPEIKIPAHSLKALHLDEKCSNFDFLKALCKQGFDKMGLKKDSKEYKAL